MQLLRSDGNGRTLEEDYLQLLQSYGHNSDVEETINDMLKLVRELEKIAYPIQWATVSHFAFYITELDTWFPEMIRVDVQPSEEGYRIKYRTKRKIKTNEDFENSFTTVLAKSVAQAVEAVEHALQHAERNLQTESWRMQHLLKPK